MDKQSSLGGGVAGGGDGGASGGGRPSTFLAKTYTIVDDPNTNSIISWGEFGNSFIIWDHLKFTAELLPKYFRHDNLSSFVYQLNNYGFRKIGCDHQWEYMNPEFERGKQHMLTNIKRRQQKPDYVARKKALSHGAILKKQMHESKLQIKKLRSQQAEMELHIMAMEEELKNAESKTKKLKACWFKACDKIIAEKMTEEIGKDDQNQEIQSYDNEAVSLTNEATLEKTLGDYAYWNSIILGDDEGEVGTAMANKQAKIARDLEDMLVMKMENPDDENKKMLLPTSQD